MPHVQELIRSDHADDNGFQPRPGFAPFSCDAGPSTLAERLIAVARRQPHATALVDDDDRVSYQQLIDRALSRGHALARQLANHPGAIAVHMSSVRASVETVLAVLCANRPYLCLPPTEGRQALDDILRSASTAAVLTDESVIPASTASLPRRASATDVACLFATSGTTGTPKLVGLSHRAVLFDIGRQTNDLFLGPDDRIDLLFHPSFVASLSSIFSALLTGAELHLGAPAAMGRPVAEWLVRSEITVTTMTVSRLRMLCATLSPADRLTCLRLVSVGGEALLAKDVRAFRSAFPESCVLQNAMASTETRTYAQYFVPRDGAPETPLPIGWPVHGKAVSVVDATGVPLPPGEDGEILVRSRFLADGYINDPRLTCARFAPQPDGTVLFRTGDRGRFREDGCLLFLGRNDSQLKIRGYRVSPQSVEHALLADERVREAAVVRRTIGSEDTLAAFVALERGCQIGEREIRGALVERLPPHAIPSSVHVVPALPLNRNGKVDYQSLTAEATAGASPTPRETDPLSALCEIFAETLARDLARPDDDFFACGGDSLNAIRLQVLVHERIGVELSLETLVAHPTPRELAAWFTDAPQATHPALVTFGGDGNGLPLFCIPGIGGEPAAFSHLANHVGRDRPVYGLRATLASERPGQPLHIEEIAREYVRAIDTVLPRQAPVHLCGHSFGGLVALEIAHQFLGAGRRLGLFVIIDTPLNTQERRLMTQVRDIAANLPAWLWYDALHSTPSVILGRVMGKIVDLTWQIRFRMLSKQGTYYPDLRAYFGTLRVPSELAARVHARYDAARRYVRRPLPISMVLLRSRAQALMGRNDRCLGWDALAEGVTVFDVPGHHDSCYRPPYVGRLAAVLAERLRGADVV